MPTDLRVTLAGIELKNPVIAASGTFGYGLEFEDVVHLDRLGGFVVKGLSREPIIGNPPPRLYETAAGMLNAIGLANVGLQTFLDEKLPKLRELRKAGPRIIVNVAGHSFEDYTHTAGTIATIKVAVATNIPNRALAAKNATSGTKSSASLRPGLRLLCSGMPGM